MKRLIAFLLAAVTILSLCACGTPDNAETTPSTTVSTEPTEPPREDLQKILN